MAIPAALWSAGIGRKNQSGLQGEIYVSYVITLKVNLLLGYDNRCSKVQGYSRQAGGARRNVACVWGDKCRKGDERNGRTCLYAARTSTEEVLQVLDGTVDFGP